MPDSLIMDAYSNFGFTITLMSGVPDNRKSDMVRGGDTASPLPDYETIIGLYHKKIFNLILRILCNHEEASDLTQEVFIRAYKSYPRFVGNATDVYSWLRRIAINISNDRLKALIKQNRYEVVSLDSPILPNISQQGMEISDSSNDPEGVLQSRVMVDIIQKAIDRLPPEFRIVIVLRDMQDLSYHEISESIGISVDMVKIRIHRGREMLRRQLSSYLAG